MPVIANDSLFVKSHVSRDLLQNAALFKTDKLVIWEYVSNGLQYVDPGTNPTVFVRLDSKARKLQVCDNGRGMTLEGLKNFFVMHGENLDRKAGTPGRGRFGTGKSAAFGIANLLRVTSVRDDRRTVVELSRPDLETISSGEPIPVRILQNEVSCSEPNGTVIDIEQIHLRSLDQAGCIRYIERHLAKWPKNCTVFVNNHECEYFEPPIAEQRRFKPTGALLELVGDVELVIKVSKAPVDEDLRGISIFSNGVWHETTLAGAEGKEMSGYIIGEIDVPRLDDDVSPISPFDLSRSMRLNPSNELVRAVYAFVAQSIEKVRRDLAERDRERRASEDAKRLAAQAAEIARFLNEDFDTLQDKISRIRTKAAGLVDLNAAPAPGDSIEGLTTGSEIPSVLTSPAGGLGAEGDGGLGGEVPRELMPELKAQDDGKLRGNKAPQAERQTSKRGGFSVEFKAMGAEDDRAKYVGEERKIYINVDHPQLSAAKGSGSVEDLAFRRLAYEVAFTEYAIAISYELGRRGEYAEWSDPLYDVRHTVNRLARRGARLYAM
jgi:hypothetical protein